MILSTKLLRRVNKSAGKICDKCKKDAEYYDAALPVESFAFYCGNHCLLEDLDPDDVLNQRMLGGMPVSRKMAFPECADIEELFAATPRPTGIEKRHTLQMYASVMGFPRMSATTDVVARPAVAEWIREHSIYSSDPDLDKNHFIQINPWDEQKIALISLKFQQILGTHYLAIVPWKTVEKFFGASQK